MAAADSARFLLDMCVSRLNRLRDILALIGIAYTGQLTLQLVWALLAGFRTHLLPWCRPRQLSGYGRWAVVTGCTDGIGKAYCHQLAKRGLDLVLISRNVDKLERTAMDLTLQYNVKTQIIVADFSEGDKVYPRIVKELQDKDIGILVNNVGVMYEYPMLFHEVKEEELWKHIMVNAGAVTFMTHTVLPGMLLRQRGAIINLSSSSAIYPLPLMAVYSATKAYVDFFTRAIQHEYRDSGVVIQCLMPFYVSTAMTQFSGTLQRLTWFVPDANTFAEHALATLGYASRTTGHWSHGLQYLVLGTVPEWVWLRLGSLMQRYLRRDAKLTKRKLLLQQDTSGVD